MRARGRGRARAAQVEGKRGAVGKLREMARCGKLREREMRQDKDVSGEPFFLLYPTVRASGIQRLALP